MANVEGAVLLAADPAWIARIATEMENAPHRFSFVRQRWQNGILGFLKAAMMGCSGIFLLTEIPKTPSLTVQMAVVGILLTFGGLACLVGVVRDFWGSLTVDVEGIRVGPGFLGFAVPWTRIARCQFRDGEPHYSAFPSLKVWEIGRDVPHVVPNGYLSHHDQQLLRRVLLAGRRG